MRLFRYLRNRRPVETGETPLQRFCRYLIVIALFGAVVWGFSENSKRQLNLLKKNNRQIPVEPLVEKPFPFAQHQSSAGAVSGAGGGSLENQGKPDSAASQGKPDSSANPADSASQANPVSPASSAKPEDPAKSAGRAQ